MIKTKAIKLRITEADKNAEGLNTIVDVKQKRSEEKKKKNVLEGDTIE